MILFIYMPLYITCKLWERQFIYKLTKEFKESHTETPWRMIEKMRHILVHDYYQINLDILWIVINEDLSILEEQIKKYISDFKE